VAYRSSHPDEETVKDVLKALQENNIDVSQLLEYSADHCPKFELPKESATSALRQWRGKWKQHSSVSNFLGE
jgi:hypothetical protein